MWHRPLLALISPDQSYNDKHSLLVATIVQRPVIQDCIKQGGTKIPETLPIQTSWLMAYSETGNPTYSKSHQNPACEAQQQSTRTLKLWQVLYFEGQRESATQVRVSFKLEWVARRKYPRPMA